MRFNRKRRCASSRTAGPTPDFKLAWSRAAAARRTAKSSSSGRTAAMGAAGSAPAGRKSCGPNARSKWSPSFAARRSATRPINRSEFGLAAFAGANRTTTAGAISGRQKTGASDAAKAGSAGKPQAPMGRKPASRAGQVAAVRAPTGGLVMGTIEGIAPQELPGVARCVELIDLVVVSVPAPVTRRHYTQNSAHRRADERAVPRESRRTENAGKSASNQPRRRTEPHAPGAWLPGQRPRFSRSR